MGMGAYDLGAEHRKFRSTWEEGANYHKPRGDSADVVAAVLMLIARIDDLVDAVNRLSEMGKPPPSEGEGGG